MKQVVRAARGSQQQGGTLREAFADKRVEAVVNAVLVFPQQLHHRVVRPAEEDTAEMVVNGHLTLQC